MLIMILICSGLYTAVGNSTCAMGASKPGLTRGTDDYLGLGCDRDSLPECAVAKQDIEDYVSWGIDHLKVDGCWEFDHEFMNESYGVIGTHLRDASSKMGRPITHWESKWRQTLDLRCTVLSDPSPHTPETSVLLR